MEYFRFREKKIKTISDKIVLSKGTLIFVGERKDKEENINVIDYNQTIFKQKEFKEIEENLHEIEDSRVRWIDIDKLGQIDNIEII